MRYFLSLLALALGLVSPADAQQRFYGPNAGGYGPSPSGGGGGGAGLTIGTIALSTITFTSPTAYSATATVGLSGNGTVTLGGSLALSTAGACSGAASTENGSFVLGTNWVLSGPSTPGTYHICLAATVTGATNSPKYQAFIITGTAAYVGIADTSAGMPLHYWGVRAVSAAEATAGTFGMFRVQRPSDNHVCRVAPAANGGLGNVVQCEGAASGDTGTFASWLGGQTARVFNVYDHGSGAACDIGEAVNPPTITVAAPYLNFNGSNMRLIGACAAIAVPLTFVAAINPTGAGDATYGIILGHGQSAIWGGHYMTWTSAVGTGYTANQVNLTDSANGTTFAQNAGYGSLTPGNWGSIAGVFSSTTSRVPCLTGTCGTGDTTTSIVVPSQTTIGVGSMPATTSDVAANSFNGVTGEVAIYGSALTTTLLKAVCQSQYSFGWSTAAC